MVTYARLSKLPEIRAHCQLAYESVREELGNVVYSRTRSEKKLHFVDVIRDLIDYTESANLPKTHILLIRALNSAADHLNELSLDEVTVAFPDDVILPFRLKDPS
ncbi:MAG: hypothetical protein ABIV25_14500 [Paracoccaceae bacterium]